MALACELAIDNKPQAEVVLLRNAVYLLNDDTLAKVTPHLVWCFSCAGFADGEWIPTKGDLQSELEQCAAPPYPAMFEFLFHSEGAIERYRQQLRRSIHLRAQRTAPAKCLQCGSEKVRLIHAADGDDFTDPLGRHVAGFHVFASTSIDLVLYVYDHNGNAMGQMSRICPDTNEYIDDGYPPQRLIEGLRAV